jgi:hypothetical protein
MPNRGGTSGGMGMFLTQAIDTHKMPPPQDATTNIRTSRMVHSDASVVIGCKRTHTDRGDGVVY